MSLQNAPRNSAARAITCLLTLLLAACGPLRPVYGKEYLWVQREDGIGMKAPIEYRVRYRWDADTLHWVTRAEDANGKVAITEDTYSTRSTLFPCQVWDDSNWKCEFADPGASAAPPVWVEMKNGKLHWFYWSEQRPMEQHTIILGRSL